MSKVCIDVAVIGASLGGSVTALQLAQAGISSMLFDKGEFSRRKACGEGLSIQGVRELELLGLKEALLSLPHVPFYGFKFLKSKQSSELLLKPLVHGIGIRRYDLDHMLVESYAQRGVPILLQSDLTIVRGKNDRFVIRSRERDDVFEARYLVLATGAHSTLPQNLGVPTFVRSRSRCGLSVALKHTQAHNQSTVGIFIDPKIQACSTPVAEDTTTLSLFCANELAYRLSYRQRDSLIREVCDRLRISALPCESVLTVSGLGRIHRKSHHRSIFVVGDALRQLDPIGGMGMTQAFLSARVTSQTVSRLMHSNDCAAKSILAEHDLILKKTLRKLVGYTSLSYWSLSTALGRRLIGDRVSSVLAREVLLSMHRPSNITTPCGLLSTLLIQSASLL